MADFNASSSNVVFGLSAATGCSDGGALRFAKIAKSSAFFIVVVGVVVVVVVIGVVVVVAVGVAVVVAVVVVGGGVSGFEPTTFASIANSTAFFFSSSIGIFSSSLS